MREECKHFQSRTYTSGEVARFCVLDLAPEAPWRCPEPCASFDARRADVAWAHGSLVEPALEDEPRLPGDAVGRLLDDAEDIVNAVVPETRFEVERERAAGESSPWRRALRRFGRRPAEPDDGFGGERGRR